MRTVQTEVDRAKIIKIRTKTKLTGRNKYETDRNYPLRLSKYGPDQILTGLSPKLTGLRLSKYGPDPKLTGLRLPKYGQDRNLSISRVIFSVLNTSTRTHTYTHAHLPTYRYSDTGTSSQHSIPNA
eukprot:Awhi_evm1s2304